MPRSRAWALALAVLGLAVPAWAQRTFPDTTHGVVVFNDQLATWNMTEAQFGFAASHYVGAQKVRRDDARHLRQYDPGGFDPGVADGHLRTRIFIAFEASPNRRLVTVVLRLLNGQYGIMGRVHLDDGTVRDTGFVDISDAPHSIQLDWKRSSTPTANDGYVQLWVDATTVGVAGLDNNLGSVDFARLGAMSVKTGAAGTLLFDKFESRRLNFIVP